jgi:hypothetical protein
MQLLMCFDKRWSDLIPADASLTESFMLIELPCNSVNQTVYALLTWLMFCFRLMLIFTHVEVFVSVAAKLLLRCFVMELCCCGWLYNYSVTSDCQKVHFNRSPHYPTTGYQGESKRYSMRTCRCICIFLESRQSLNPYTAESILFTWFKPTYYRSVWMSLVWFADGTSVAEDRM